MEPEKKVYYAHLYDNDLDTFFNERIKECHKKDAEYDELANLEDIINEWRKIKKTASDDYQVGGDHYKKNGIQPWDIIEQYSLNFFAGNIVKYILRYQFKNGLEDLQKAEHYIKKLIELEKDKK